MTHLNLVAAAEKQPDILSHYPVLLETTRKLPSGKQQRYSLYNLPREIVKPSPFNPRFPGGQPLDDARHLELIQAEDPKRTKNLEQSVTYFPVLDQPIVHLDSQTGTIEALTGNRRIFAVRKSGQEDILVWVVRDLSDEDKTFIRDYPETNPTKVDHCNYAIARNIWGDLSKVRGTEREPQLTKLGKRYGLTRKKILDAERCIETMESQCREWAENPEDRKDNFRAFQAYDSLRQREFNELRDKGQFELLKNLDTVAKAYLKARIAHDDMRDTVSIMAKRPEAASLLAEIEKGSIDLGDITSLRRLTEEARLLNRTAAGNLLDEVKKTLQKWHLAALNGTPVATLQEIERELTNAAAKMNALVEAQPQ